MSFGRTEVPHISSRGTKPMQAIMAAKKKGTLRRKPNQHFLKALSDFRKAVTNFMTGTSSGDTKTKGAGKRSTKAKRKTKAKRR